MSKNQKKGPGLSAKVCCSAKESLESKVEDQPKAKKKYAQEWPEYNMAQTKEKIIFYRLLDELLTIIPEKNYSHGRPPHSLRTKLFSCMIKTYNITSSRRTMSDIEMASREGYIDRAPHFNTILNQFHDSAFGPTLRYLIQVSALPLKSVESSFAIDSSGFGTTRHERWLDIKDRHNGLGKYKKAHVIIGAKTNVVAAAFITEGDVADITVFEPLLARTKQLFNIEDIVADKAYGSRDNHNVANDAGATPYIPFKSNVTGRSKGSPTWARMYKMFTENYEEFARHYHKRSNVESTFSMIKRKFGDSCRCKLSKSQENEILCKILAHNIVVLVHEMCELGIDIDFWKCSGEVLAQKES